MSAPIQVLYVAGLPHSGSTVLARLLGEAEGLFSAGEVYALGERLSNGDLCGCGLRLGDCPFWSAVLADAVRDGDGLERLRTERRWIKARSLPAVALGHERRRLRNYRQALSGLYRAIASVSGARVIVDSSKSPTYLHILRGVPGVDVAWLHLVRDPRAVSYSWSVDPHFHRTRGPAFGARWTLWNLELETFAARERSKSLRLRYEDFATRPEEEARRALSLVGAGDAALPFVGERSVLLPAHHMIEGHASRFDTGTIQIQPSTAWRRRLSKRRAVTSLATASPLRFFYGYGSD